MAWDFPYDVLSLLDATCQVVSWQPSYCGAAQHQEPFHKDLLLQTQLKIIIPKPSVEAVQELSALNKTKVPLNQ